MAFVLSKRDLFTGQEIKDATEKVSLSMHSNSLSLYGGLELIFSIQLSPAFTSTHVQINMTEDDRIIITDRYRLALIEMRSCFSLR